MKRPDALRRGLISAAAVAAMLPPASAWAWGATGHRIVTRVAVAALPADLPAFLRAPGAAAELAELSREPDRWRGSGRVHDNDRDAAHFLDLDADGRIAGGPSLSDLPPTRAAYAAALRTAGADEPGAGYLPYAIIDAWQQLAKDLAYWRAVTAAEAHAADPQRRTWFAADRARRETLAMRDLAVLAHYVGDGGMPLHVSAKHDGWTGDNPRGFTTSRIHAAIEGAFVRANITAPAVALDIAPYRDCGCWIDARTRAYLASTAAFVVPLYELEQAGGFKGADARGTEFLTRRLAAGASELRDMIAMAWNASARASVGYPALSVADIESGKADPYDSLYGLD
jgi:hypothetical protein